MARSPLQTVMGPRFGGNKSDDELLELVGKSTPLGRIGQPEEVAHQILFLLSDLASFTTGQIICVSGGQ
jgi:3-oxoacyl-[acyl-carrier protein] reductase